MKEFLKKIPIPTAGVALGLAALGNLLVTWSDIARGICGILSLCLVVFLVAKIAVHPRLIRDDLNNSILASVSGTLFMSFMQLATYAASFAYAPAFFVWAIAVAGHGVLIVWFTAKFIMKFKLPEVFPTYFICYVGIIVASVTSPTFGMQALGLGLFWFGFICYIVLFALITLRYFKHEIPEGARPLFCIYAAPMSLSLVGYLSVENQPIEAFVITLMILAQLLLFFVLFHLPKFVRLDFYPSYAAMTFPFVISATALLRGRDFLVAAGNAVLTNPAALMALDVLILLETVFATCMVAYVFIHYVRFFYREFAEANSPEVIAEERAARHFAENFEN